jgi:hypothetical protein
MSMHKWDFSKFTRGERFVYRPLPQSEFDQTLEQVKRWNLDQYLKEKSFDKLVYRASEGRPARQGSKKAQGV